MQCFWLCVTIKWCWNYMKWSTSPSNSFSCPLLCKVYASQLEHSFMLVLQLEQNIVTLSLGHLFVCHVGINTVGGDSAYTQGPTLHDPVYSQHPNKASVYSENTIWDNIVYCQIFIVLNFRNPGNLLRAKNIRNRYFHNVHVSDFKYRNSKFS